MMTENLRRFRDFVVCGLDGYRLKDIEMWVGAKHNLSLTKAICAKTRCRPQDHLVNRIYIFGQTVLRLNFTELRFTVVQLVPR